MAHLNFNVCHALANYYFYFHCSNKKSFTHNVCNSHFFLWIYYNDDYEFNAHDELKIILRLAHDYGLKKHGWDCNVTLTTFKAAQYEIFDNVVAVIFSPKKRR